MQTVNIQEAKVHLGKLVEQAAKGHPFVISKSGRPLVKVIPITSPGIGQKKRLGFMKGQIIVPDDFNRMGSTEIEQMFYGDK